MAIVEDLIIGCALDGSAQLRVRYNDVNGNIQSLVFEADIGREVEVFVINQDTLAEVRQTFVKRSQGNISLASLGVNLVLRNGIWTFPQPYKVGAVFHDPRLR